MWFACARILHGAWAALSGRFGGAAGGAAFGGPSVFGDLVGAAEGEGVGGDGVGDAGAGGDVGPGTDLDGGDEGGVGADEGSVADGGGVLEGAVVVAGNGSGTDVDACADDGVAEVGEVVGLGAFADGDLFGLAKVADVGLLADARLGAEVGVGAEDGSVPTSAESRMQPLRTVTLSPRVLDWMTE